ncbi:MAG: O-antigen translocase [Muribaculaceae bacterium]|nr:O-antigen translocase [Muribaculaceae bacterium]
MSELKEENSYRNILKRLSAFGGVQIFNIIIGILRGKFVAMFLGPAGMGISSLFASSTAPMQQIGSLGLNLAMVKEISAAKDEPSRLRKTIAIVLKLLLATSLFGTLICAIGAPLWSELSFGSHDYTISYFWLSIFVGLSIAGGGFLALLQGLGEVRRLSKASLVGGMAGLLFGVPLYYFFGDSGIVPAMIILAFSSFLFYYISYRESPVASGIDKKDASDKKETRQLIRKLISIGAILLIGSLVGQLVNYAINLFIRTTGSLDDVGLYQGANSITNQYIGLIISALALDYFPRLSACASDGERMREVVNRQIEIVMLVGTPLIILLILTAPLLIRILLTNSFLVIVPLMRWLGLGMLIQLIAFPIGYIYIARDDRKAYIWLECVWANVCWIGSSILFYYLFGLTGLGIGLTVRSIIDLIINFLFCRRRYALRLSSKTLMITFVTIVFSASAFLLSFSENILNYIFMTAICITSILYSINILRKKIVS